MYLIISSDFILFIDLSLFYFYFIAEFIITLAKKNSTFENFKRVLLENGAEFSVCLILLQQLF